MKRTILLLLAAVFFVGAQATNVAQKAAGSEQPPPDYLIICANDFWDVAVEWGRYRTETGRRTHVSSLANIATDMGKESVNLVDLKKFIKGKQGGDKPTEGFQVLLIGDCPTDGSEGYDAKTQIPWFMSTYKDAFERSTIPGDNYLADQVGEDNEIPDLAIGRIPAKTAAQAKMALAKVQTYEKAKLGEWSRRLTFFAGEGRFGAAVDQMLENLFTQMAEQVIDPAYDLRMTYANIKSPYAYVPSKFSDKVIEEANQGAMILSYMGHGAPDRLDDMHVPQGEGKRDVRYPILTAEDVAKFKIEEGKLPVMIIVACATGFMDGKDDCISERICFTEKAPVAIVSSNRDSHPYSNTLLQNAMITEITKNRRVTLGEAFLRAKREIVLGEDKNRKNLETMAQFIIPKKSERDKLNRAHLYLYNLIGDPGLKLRHSNSEVKCLTRKAVATLGQSFSTKFSFAPALPIAKGSGPFVGDATVEAHLEVRRSQVASALQPFTAADLISTDAAKRKAAEDAVASNHAAANTKWVCKGELMGSVMPGDQSVLEEVTVEIKIDEALAPGDYVVKLFALDSKGQHCGFAALKLQVIAKE